MKAYWDSSALVLACQNDHLRDRLTKERGFARIHVIVETFSTLTGGALGFKLDADEVAKLMDSLAEELDFVELTPQETLAALRHARKRGVRGGRVHDYMHALAAKKAQAHTVLTSDMHDFTGLVPELKIEVIQQ